jgi:hypothetical protein
MVMESGLKKKVGPPKQIKLFTYAESVSGSLMA